MKFIINLAKNYIVVYKKRERRQMPKTLLLSKCFHNGKNPYCDLLTFSIASQNYKK